MKSACLLSLALVCAASATAQDRASTPTVPPVQAPPAINDPGVTPQPAAPAAPAAVAPAENLPPDSTEAKPLESPGLPAEVQAAAEATELPVVTVRQQGSDTVEEYRKRGKLYFVRVLSNSGPPRFYVDNPQAVPANVMSQISGPSGVVQPVYYKLIEWSKPQQ